MRPVGARALKSAGDTLRPYLAGGRVLDLFAGQGRFGKMALEEGAASVVFVEKSRRTAGDLTVATLKDRERCRVVADEALRFLGGAATRGEQFDIVFADPPFPLWNDAFSAELFAAAARVLARGAIFLVKHPSRVVPSMPVSGSSSHWNHWKSSPFGESRLLYFRYGQGEESPDEFHHNAT